MPKSLTAREKQMILNVRRFFEEKKAADDSTIDFNKIIENLC